MRQPQAQQAPQQQAAQGFSWRGLIVQMVIMYLVYSYVFKPSTNTTDPKTGKDLPPHRPIFKGGERLQLYVYMSEDANFTDFNNSEALIWRERDIFFDWREENTREKDFLIRPSQRVLNNATLYVHVYFVKNDHSPDPAAANYKKTAAVHGTNTLNTYLPRPKLKGKMNLITGELEDSPELLAEQKRKDSGPEFISFWKPNLTLSLVHDFTVFPRGSLPQQLTDHMNFDATGNYWPTLFFNEFWLMREHLFPINETTPELPLKMSYSTLSLWRWQMMIQMQQSLQMQESLGGTEGEADDVKRMLSDTNPYLLGLTLAVSILHTVFDFLAFKNDISFWKNRKSLEGLSVRTIFWNVAMQFVIFLYLFDNDTSWIILVSAGVGLLIEGWKITKALEVSILWPSTTTPSRNRSLFDSIPRIQFKDRNTYTDSKTKEYDTYAMRYLSYLLYPLVIGYAIYSLTYQTHKSWYSWVLNSLTGCIYTFGFIMMTPQLFINYKLKSVAHMPWKTFMYKALNTFVDDLFAFIIKMPTMHRMACFRDDIIFFIFLYQRWIYPVDKARVNEFGQGGTDEVAEEPATGNGAAVPTTTNGNEGQITTTSPANNGPANGGARGTRQRKGKPKKD